MTTPVASTPEVTTIISDAVRTQVDAAINRIPEGKKGQAEAWITKQGVEGSVGWKMSEKWDAALWGTRRWDGTWDAGARARVTW